MITLLLKITIVVPAMILVMFHNLSGYDSHFLIKDIAVNWEGSIDVLPLTKEKFMNSGLEELDSYLTEFLHMIMEFPELDDGYLNLLRRKGVFPYDYLDNINKFEQTI
ncbi:unnamed protein product [Psylliodes chrysocephalus]|uniref:Uncharacterized protein n=1 Tax=Psylliodes chrysocephalus TaxID=3402493 RepID=A0A9P0GM77_9CUCU|nr:unnamed protein product [Psylliodes chrysocephala]